MSKFCKDCKHFMLEDFKCATTNNSAYPNESCSDFTESCPEEEVDDAALNNYMEHNIIRKHNVGNSNYSTMPNGYQPWDLWKVYHLNPWDADIIKRLLRTKAESGMTPQESRKLDYEKIIHVCQERINQINEGYEF